MRSDRLMRAAVVALLLATGATALAACGKKGPPELPEGVHDQYPRQYPDPDEY